MIQIGGSSPGTIRDTKRAVLRLHVYGPTKTHCNPHDRHCPHSDAPFETTVRRLVDDLMADLEAIPDHRDRRGRVYPLASLLAIHVLAAVGDANSPEDAADFARDHAAWLRGLGLLGDRIPSAQTLRRLLRDRGPDCWRSCSPWWRGLAAACAAAAESEEAEKPEGKEEDEGKEPPEGCAVDGKSVRRSGDAARGLRRTHIVSARLDNGLTIGQAAVPAKGNELTAIRQLLPALELKDRVVSIDAMGCRTDVAETIADADGWYLLAVTDSESKPAPQPAARLRLPGPHRRRGPRPARDRGAEARTHRAPHLHHHGRGPRHPGRNRSRPALGRAGLRRAHGRRTHRARPRPHHARRTLLHLHLPVDIGAARMANLVRGHWGRREQPALGAGRHLPGGSLPPAHRPRRPQHGGPAARRPEHSCPPAAVFWPKLSIRRLRKMVARNPARLEPLMAL